MLANDINLTAIWSIWKKKEYIMTEDKSIH